MTFLLNIINETVVGLHVYRKCPPPDRGGVGHAGGGDGFIQGWGGACRGIWVIQGWGGSQRGEGGHAGVGWVIQGWGGSYWGGVGHTGVGWGGSWQGWGGLAWVIQEWGGVGHAGVWWVGSYRGGIGWVMKNIKILKILNYLCYRVSNPANQNQICRVLKFLNHDKWQIKLLSDFLCNSHTTFYKWLKLNK